MDYLLEIGTEELPASYIEKGLKDLEKKVKSLLNERNLNFEQITTYSSPRRLALIISDLDEYEEEKVLEQKGPSEEIAFDEEGNPTQALNGFMKSQDVTIDDIEIRDSYVYISKTIEPLHIKDIFYEKIPEIVKSIDFPKSMHWHSSDFSFARPIRWIVSIFGEEVLDLDFGDIPVSNTTKGHRFLGSQDLKIHTAKSYPGQLKANYVIPDPEERQEMIVSQSEIIASQKGGIIKDDTGLLDELVNIVEYPTAIVGSIKDQYLSLPPIVITTAIREHLRFIPLYEDETSDKLLASFISIVNGTQESKDTIIRGNEKVLGARLQDAKFFYQDDLKLDLEELTEKLDDIIYQEKLGTMKDKVKRLVYLVERLGDQLSIAEAAKDDVKRAAYLSKADLLTGLVNEFPELQGTMGSIYAKNQGESNLVSKAIEDQYLPRHSGDELPSTTVGSILSMADKLDSICGMFAVGIKPTGSQDPYGLRRAAIGVINIILDKAWLIDIKESINFSLYSYVEENSLVYDYEEVKDDIFNFFKSRIRVNLLDSGARYDIVDAILALEEGQILNIYKKVDQLSQWIGQGQEKTLESLKRLSNITSKSELSGSFDSSIFDENEKALEEAFETFKNEISELGTSLKYPEVLEKLSSLNEPINNYFENVHVFVDNEIIKNNRLNFLISIDKFIKENIFDFSKIVE